MHTTNFLRVDAISSVQVAFDLELFPANACCLIPVYLSDAQCAVAQPNRGDALSLPPPAATVELAQAHDFAVRTPYGKGLDIRDEANNLEMHGRVSPRVPEPSSRRLTLVLSGGAQHRKAAHFMLTAVRSNALLDPASRPYAIRH